MRFFQTQEESTNSNLLNFVVVDQARVTPNVLVAQLGSPHLKQLKKFHDVGRSEIESKRDGERLRHITRYSSFDFD